MICQKCKSNGELKVFATFQYYYCNTCKDEIKLEENTSTKTESHKNNSPKPCPCGCGLLAPNPDYSPGVYAVSGLAPPNRQTPTVTTYGEDLHD